MADTIKTLEGQISTMNKSIADKQKKLEKLIPAFVSKTQTVEAATNFVENEFFGDAVAIGKKCKLYFGKEVMSLVDARKALKKLQDDLKKVAEERDTLVSETGGLTVQIQALTKKLDAYKKGKEALKGELDSGKIDRKEYEFRKNLIKTSLADTSKIHTGKLKAIEKKLQEKTLALKKLDAVLEKKTDVYTDANKFVTKDFMGDSVAIGKKCKLYFGKAVMSLVEARKALEKMKQDLEKTKKEHQTLSAEAAALDSQIKEAKKRWDLYEQDMQRTNNSLESGKIDTAEWKRQSENFKKSLALT